jgi:hypothetical protein
MNPRVPGKGKGSIALLGNGKGNQHLGGRGLGPVTTHSAVGVERRKGPAAGAAAVTTDTNTQRTERKTMTELVRHNIQTLQNTVKGNTKVQLSKDARL